MKFYLLAEMDPNMELENELGESSINWRSQKKKLESEKAALQEALCVKKGHVKQLEALLEECQASLDYCDGRIEMAELIDELLPPGAIDKKLRALKGWMRIRKILREEKLGFQEMAQKCLQIFASHIEDTEAVPPFESGAQNSSGKGFQEIRWLVPIQCFCFNRFICFSREIVITKGDSGFDAKDFDHEVESASDALVGLMFEEVTNNGMKS